MCFHSKNAITQKAIAIDAEACCLALSGDSVDRVSQQCSSAIKVSDLLFGSWHEPDAAAVIVLLS